MDLYLFYNCICNMNEIFTKNDDELTLEDEKLFNNPLVLYNYYNNSLYKTGHVAEALANPGLTITAAQYATSGVSGLGNSIRSIQIGSAKDKAAAKAEKAAKKDAKKKAKKEAKEAKKAEKEAKKGEKGEKKEGENPDDPKKPKEGAKEKLKGAIKEGALKGFARRENQEETDELIDMLKTFMKTIIIILIIVCIPIVPWILISFYAFQNLSGFIQNNLNNL